MTHAQSIARTEINPDLAARDANARAIAALKRLDNDVIVYRSLGEFEESRKLARVSLKAFERDLNEVTREVQPVVDRMRHDKLRTQLTNSLDSFRDGLFWWRQVDQPRVINVSALGYADANHTAADAAFLSNVPYTVAINWRQAEKYLIQAERTLNQH